MTFFKRERSSAHASRDHFFFLSLIPQILSACYVCQPFLFLSFVSLHTDNHFDSTFKIFLSAVCLHSTIYNLDKNK